MARTLSAKQVLTIKFDTIRLGGGWDECVGEIETTGIWFIWGEFRQRQDLGCGVFVQGVVCIR